jgi:chromosome segregation ATPase
MDMEREVKWEIRNIKSKISNLKYSYNHMNNQTVTKLKDTEIKEISDLQSKFQTIRLKLGDQQIEKMALDDAVASYLAKDKSLKDEFLSLQQAEKALIDKILSVYGEGSISLSDGTFISTSEST